MREPDLEQTLERLLGPAEPEVGCEVCFDELDRYVELELAGHDADSAIPGLQAHLDGCPACREEHESLVALVRDDDGGKLAPYWANRERRAPARIHQRGKGRGI